MSTQSFRFRPSLQPLEGRRLMAGDLGFEEVAATPEEPARNVTIVGTTISGNTADSVGQGGGIYAATSGDPARVTIQGAGLTGNTAFASGGGILNTGESLAARAGGGIENNSGATDDYFAELGSDSPQKMRPDEIEILSWSWGETNDR